MENKTATVKKSLYLKYRPQDFDSLIGQDHIKQILQTSAKNNALSQGYLLIGPRGTGKTTTARLIAKTLNCYDLKAGAPCQKCEACVNIQRGHFIDVIEIDAASNTGVDDMRDLIEKAQFTPTLGQHKVYIIDEVHMLSKSAFNALLKTLEEPPSHVHFILATTEVNKVPPTIISRCQRFDFNRILPEDIVKRLKYICKKESYTYDEKALDIIANNADGGLRDAISLIEQVVLDKKIIIETVEFSLGIVKSQFIEEFVNLLFEKKTNLALQLLQKIYQEGVNLVQFKKEVLEFLRIKLLKSFDKNNTHYDINKLLKLSDDLNNTNVENAIIPQFPFELLICKFTLSDNHTAVIKNTEESKEQPKKSPPVSTPQKKEEPKPKIKKIIEEAPTQQTIVTKIDKIEPEKPEEYKFTPDELPERKFTVKPTLEKIQEDWFDILKEIEQPTLKLAFKDTFLESLKDDVLNLSVGSEFHYNRIKKNESKAVIEDLLKKHFDVEIKMNISLSKIKVNPDEYIPVETEIEEPFPESTNEKPEAANKKSSDDINPDKVYDLFNN